MTYSRAMILVLVVLTAGGCLSPGPKDTQRQSFVLDVSRPSDPKRESNGETLEVRPMRVASSFQGTGFVYRREALRFESDYYNEFFTSPGSMVTQEVREWLTDSGLFNLVLDSGSGLKVGFLLEGSVTALYGDYTDPNDPRGVLIIRFSLIDDRSTRPRPVLQREYREMVSLPEVSPQGLVRGWNKALTEVLGRLEADVSAEFAALGSP